jgi:predicted MPP superfamily phosphohydrolase
MQLSRTDSTLKDLELDPRHIWATVRFWMEVDNYKYLREGGRRKHHWDTLEIMLKVFGVGLKMTGLHGRGVSNAENLFCKEFKIHCPGLPASFDGYTILHITDPHFDALPAFEERIIELVSCARPDLCAFTGDYRKSIHGNFRQILPAMKKLTSAIQAKDGIVATLGNHDTVLMVNEFEKMGVRMLANESVSIMRGNEQLHITGIDDVHYYYTPMAMEAFDTAPAGFKIALVHSPELYDLAAEHGYDLYLAGHTHGGQITLPDQKPILKHLHNGKHLATGWWRHKSMQGYTSNGAGVSGLPVRFNTRGEVTLISLFSRQQDEDKPLK